MRNLHIIQKPLYLFTIFTCLLFLLTSVVSADSQWKAAAGLLSEAPGKQVMVKVEKENIDRLVLTYQVPEVTFATMDYQKIRGRYTELCEMGNAMTFYETGKPRIPFIQSRIIIPYGKAIEQIKVVPLEVVKLPGIYELSYGEIPHRIDNPVVTWAQPDEAIYNSDNPFPGKTHELLGISYRCGVAIGNIDIFPLSYRPLSGTISYCKRLTLEVTFKPDVNMITDVKPRPSRILEGKITEDNLGALNTYPRPRDTKSKIDYLVIAPQNFINASTTPKISDLVAQRESQGFVCKVEDYGQVGGDHKTLRTWIKNYYNENAIKWVLLVGDAGNPQIIPCYPGSEPSDLPLQCLDGNSWSNDYEAEVFIGRISAGTAAEVANQIYKILAYENNSGSYWTSGLSCGEELDSKTYGKAAMQELAGYFDDSWSWKDLHDQDGKWNKSEVIEIINSDEISIINHLGHSNATYTMKMRNGDESKFTNTNYIFVKTQGCIPGKYTVDCIAERFTTDQRKGFFAGVLNSNYGYYRPGDPTGGSSHQLHRAFWKACWEKDMEYFGEFNEYSHRTCTRYKKDVMESNLFGCPAIKFRGRDIAPYIAVMNPSSGEKVEQGFKYTIKWGDNIDGKVKIELLKGSSVDEVLADATESDGLFEWDVPKDKPIGDDYKVKVISVDSSALFTESKAFSITPEYIIATFPFLEDMEKLTSETEILSEKWVQLINDDFNWLVLTGPPPSKEYGTTGPDGDHTSGSGKYIYMEASNPNNPSKKANFSTPKFNLKNLSNPELTFFYHMFSDSNHMGELHLDIEADGKLNSDVVVLKDPDYGDKWHEQKVDLSKYVGERVIFHFRGITGKSYASDICLDDIAVKGAPTGLVNGKLQIPINYNLMLHGSNLHFHVPGSTKKPVPMSLKLFNMQGKVVKNLVQNRINPGYHTINLDDKMLLTAGMYLARMECNGFVKTIPVILNK